MSASLTSEPESDFVCECEKLVRSACAGEPFYKEHEGKRYCVLHFPGTEKSLDFQKAFQRKLDNKDFNFCGVWFPDELSFCEFDFSGAADFDSATFCAEAYFGSATFSAAANFSVATFSAAADFNSATFSAEAHFDSATFSAAVDFGHATFGAKARFVAATFSAKADFIAATFSANANFISVTFSADAYFASATFAAQATFSGTFSAVADFTGATFSAEADFSSATFSADAYFSSATFSADANFSFATLSAAADFREATFADYVRFAGHESQPVFTDMSQLDLQFVRVEIADHISFHTSVLRPHWFVNVDAWEFDFTNVEWIWRPVGKEVASLRDANVSSPHRLLAITCRQLAVNAEQNHRYEEASKFRFMAMDARRLETWRGFAFWRLSWWYWLASGYGERSFQALLVLIGILLVAAALYTRVGFARWEPRLTNESDVVLAKRDDIGAPLRFGRALTYSAGVMTLQKPEPRPATTAAQTVVLLETILGPVQAALLALAIRRKFMR